MALHWAHRLMLLSLDIRKTFNTLFWTYLRVSLTHRGMGDSFPKWIAVLYSYPSATVKYMGHESLSFSIARGTCLGCPLSPLLFIIALEPLAAHICLSPDIRDIELTSVHHKLVKFADDLLMYITSLHITLPNLVSRFNGFSSLSRSLCKSGQIPRTKCIFAGCHSSDGANPIFLSIVRLHSLAWNHVYPDILCHIWCKIPSSH